MKASTKRDFVLQILQENKKQVFTEIKKYLKSPPYPSFFNIPLEYERFEKFHWRVVSEYPKRMGKYLRPSLVILTVGAFGKSLKLSIKTAAAIQVSEEWLLIHDDILDDSILRRGKPTLHKMYGVGIAVNSGDVLQTIMWKMLFDNLNLVGEEIGKRVIEEFFSFIMRTELGQMVEIRLRKESLSKFKKNDWYFIADGKTGYYTIAGPLRLGAIISQANEEQIKALTDFGLLLGRCFQLVDDILDVSSNFKGMKEFANDIYEAKPTLILWHLINNSSASDRRKILLILKKRREEKTLEDIAFIVDKMKEYKSIDYAKGLLLEYKRKILEAFESKLKFLSYEPFRTKLKILLEFIIERDY